MPQQILDLRRRAAALMAGFSSGQKAVTAVALLAIVIGGVFFTSWASKPSYAPLFTNLESSDAAAITQKLASEKVSYQLADGGRTVMVPAPKVYQLRIDLSAAGLPNGGGGGYSLLDKEGLTTSEFRRRVDYQRALEGELVRTITAIDGVAGASVHLVIPADDVFADTKQQSSASVLLKTAPGKTVNPDQVQAIVHLVSSSVEGLDPNQVTVADNKGQLLNTPGEDGVDAAVASTRSRQTSQFEDNLARSVEDLLVPVVGHGKAIVKVNADLDYSQRSVTTETYDTSKPAPAISESTSKETFTGTGAPPSGVLGNPSITSGTGNSNYQKDDAQRAFGVGKVTEELKVAPGQVQRLSVAVVVDRKAAVGTAEVQRVVAAAAGLDTKRGDTIQVSRMTFDDSQAKAAAKELAQAESTQKMSKLMGLARQVAILLVGGLVLFFARKSLKSASPRRLPVTVPLDLQELETKRVQLETARQAQAIEAVERDPVSAQQLHVEAVKSEVGQMIEQQPDEVAQLLRGWLADRR